MKSFHRNFANFTRKKLLWESVCNKVYSQETSKQVLSGEILENLNTYFEEHLSVNDCF